MNLTWTRLQGSNIVLQMTFGMTGTSISVYLRFGRHLLKQVLNNDTDTSLPIPSDDMIVEYQEATAKPHPSLKDVWCTMDGLKLYLEQASDCVIQNRYYNGWMHDHYVSAVFVFCPDGTIPYVTYNIPGCFHDSASAEWDNTYIEL